MPLKRDLNQLINDLRQNSFEGDIETSYAERVVASTDNSIYQQIPKAILYPRTGDDINRVVSTVNRFKQQGFSLCARGGGTGTNGQSLSDSLILDCSRYLNKILAFDQDKQTVQVEPGVILDQLNTYLKPHGLFFPIDISSSSRATLGGMVATDASGKGSLIYGKTSDHIEKLDLVLADGSDFRAEQLSAKELENGKTAGTNFFRPVYQQLDKLQDEIGQVFPKTSRGLSGYNLKQAISSPGQFQPGFLLAGSEGTLAISKKITLRVLHMPTHKMLSVIFYDDFTAALDHVQTLLECQPAAIEMLDDKILKLARNDSVWFDVQSILQDLPKGRDIKALHFIEHMAFNEETLLSHQHKLQDILKNSATAFHVVLSKTEINPDRISALWNLRKRAVGLLGNLDKDKSGTAFVEDTAVPPQNLSAYVSDFKKILDQHHLDYGMYGHADAGVLHVRPALNLLKSEHRQLIRRISDQVALLAKKHQGVLWGEHGRGFRGEYTPLFFGEKLHPVLCEIKRHFDPDNLLNPGKLVSTDPEKSITKLDSVTLRGELDEQITALEHENYLSTLDCNGNAACFNQQADEAMCPSYKATVNKLYSPKGRASMLREWARMNSNDPHSLQQTSLEQSLFNSLQLCLSCKSCASSCPLKIDIPELKSRFLHSLHQQHRRPLSDIFIRHFEMLISVAKSFPHLSNFLISQPLTGKLLERITGLCHLPKITYGHYQNAIKIAGTSNAQLPAANKAVILLRDNYMESFDQHTLHACAQVLDKLGYQVYLSDIVQNGKLLHVKGYRKQFRQVAQRVIAQIEQLAQTGLPLISCETMTRLMFDQEFPEILQQANAIKITPIESFILEHLQLKDIVKPQIEQKVILLPHCLEQTQAKQSPAQWSSVFEQLGIRNETVSAGCCGMSGLFGHEVKNRHLSEAIFNLNWKEIISSRAESHTILASGFSCRCQIQNHHYKVQHPIQYLNSIL